MTRINVADEHWDADDELVKTVRWTGEDGLVVQWSAPQWRAPIRWRCSDATPCRAYQSATSISSRSTARVINDVIDASHTTRTTAACWYLRQRQNFLSRSSRGTGGQRKVGVAVLENLVDRFEFIADSSPAPPLIRFLINQLRTHCDKINFSVEAPNRNPCGKKMRFILLHVRRLWHLLIEALECRLSLFYGCLDLLYYAPAPMVGGTKRWCASDVCLSHTSGLIREAYED